MGDVVYVSKSRIERRQGPLRVAHLPGESQPVIYSVHGAIAEHYKVDPAKLKESHSSTIDYVISATAGGMVGTFGGALEARRIDASNGKLTADVTGEVETEDGVLVIRRIHVAMRLVAPESAWDIVERAHSIYAMRCPLYRTLHKTIQLTSSCELMPPASNSGDKKKRPGGGIVGPPLVQLNGCLGCCSSDNAARCGLRGVREGKPFFFTVNEVKAILKAFAYRVEHEMGLREDFIKIPDPINPKKEGTYRVIKLPKQPEAAKPQPMSPNNVAAMCSSGNLSPALQTKYCSQK